MKHDPILYLDPEDFKLICHIARQLGTTRQRALHVAIGFTARMVNIISQWHTTEGNGKEGRCS